MDGPMLPLSGVKPITAKPQHEEAGIRDSNLTRKKNSMLVPAQPAKNNHSDKKNRIHGLFKKPYFNPQLESHTTGEKANKEKLSHVQSVNEL